MPEQWKPVVGYEGLYEVSDHGRVRSLDKEVKSAVCRKGSRIRRGKILQPVRTPKGYLTAALYRNGKASRKRQYVHRLVLEAFTGPCPEGMECRHIDGDSQNNNHSNLQWSTHKENCQDKIDHGTNWNMYTHPSRLNYA